jgi:hypothetical protein
MGAIETAIEKTHYLYESTDIENPHIFASE